MAKKNRLSKQDVKELRPHLVGLMTALNEFYFSQQVLLETLSALDPTFEKLYLKKYQAVKEKQSVPSAKQSSLQVELLDAALEILRKKARLRRQKV